MEELSVTNGIVFFLCRRVDGPEEGAGREAGGKRRRGGREEEGREEERREGGGGEREGRGKGRRRKSRGDNSRYPRLLKLILREKLAYFQRKISQTKNSKVQIFACGADELKIKGKQAC